MILHLVVKYLNAFNGILMIKHGVLKAKHFRKVIINAHLKNYK